MGAALRPWAGAGYLRGFQLAGCPVGGASLSDVMSRLSHFDSSPEARFLAQSMVFCGSAACCCMFGRASVPVRAG